MVVVVAPAHTNILLVTATQCLSAMVNTVIAGMAVTSQGASMCNC